MELLLSRAEQRFLLRSWLSWWWQMVEPMVPLELKGHGNFGELGSAPCCLDPLIHWARFWLDFGQGTWTWFVSSPVPWSAIPYVSKWVNISLTYSSYGYEWLWLFVVLEWRLQVACQSLRAWANRSAAIPPISEENTWSRHVVVFFQSTNINKDFPWRLSPGSLRVVASKKPMTDPAGAAILMVLHGSHQYTINLPHSC